LSGASFRLDAAQGGRDQVVKVGVLELKGECSGVDSGKFEEVVDDRREQSNLLMEGWKILVGCADPVGQRLDHRLHRGERGLEVVACPGDELAAGVEEAF
jgi:hypothetical protein